MPDALQETLNKPLTSPISPRMKSAQADVAAARKPMMESMQAGAELGGLEQSMEAGREAQDHAQPARAYHVRTLPQAARRGAPEV